MTLLRILTGIAILLPSCASPEGATSQYLTLNEAHASGAMPELLTKKVTIEIDAATAEAALDQLLRQLGEPEGLKFEVIGEPVALGEHRIWLKLEEEEVWKVVRHIGDLCGYYTDIDRSTGDLRLLTASADPRAYDIPPSYFE